MPDTAPPLRRDDFNEREQDQAEARMRLSLERLGGGAGGRHGGPAPDAAAPRGLPPRRMRPARDSDASVERAPPPGVADGHAPPAPVSQLEGRAAEVARDLAAERAAHRRTRETLAEVQASVTKLQASLDRRDQARDAIFAATAEYEARAAALQAKALDAQAQREALLTADAEARRQRRAAVAEPEPVKWWLAGTEPRR